MNYKRQGTFDDLNTALFAQMDRLANASGDDIEKEIERSRAVGKLAGNIISNYNTAISFMRFQAEECLDISDRISMHPKMLGGGK